MSNSGDPLPNPADPTASFLVKLGPIAPIILISAAGLGVLSAVLPAVTVSIGGFSASASVYQDWRGLFGLLGYIAVGVLAGLALAKTLPFTKGIVLAITITSGVVLLLALLLLLAVSGGVGVSIGFGCVTNLLAALGLAGGAVVLAKREKLF